MTTRALERASLTGRDAELDEVRRWLDLLADGPAALVVGGEAGIGKATLWEVATAKAAAGDLGTVENVGG
jgi:DNA-binding NtrC family response regulator